MKSSLTTPKTPDAVNLVDKNHSVPLINMTFEEDKCMNTMTMRTKIMKDLWKNKIIMMIFIPMKSTRKIFKCIGNLIVPRPGTRMGQGDTAKMKKFKIWLHKLERESQLVLF